jgi:aerobic-type carbon monoxide dehydrogenase small subunit (CoxS/CutS family)
VHHRAVNACLCPLYAVEGAHVVTVEGECPVGDLVCLIPTSCL